MKWKFNKEENQYSFQKPEIGCSCHVCPNFDTSEFTVYLNFLEQTNMLLTIQKFKALDTATTWAEKEMKKRAARQVRLMKQIFDI